LGRKRVCAVGQKKGNQSTDDTKQTQGRISLSNGGGPDIEEGGVGSRREKKTGSGGTKGKKTVFLKNKKKKRKDNQHRTDNPTAKGPTMCGWEKRSFVTIARIWEKRKKEGHRKISRG